MAVKERPLSPFWIYRPQITSVLSITHRLTGVALALGAVLLAYWLTAAAYGPEAFRDAQALFGSWLGRLVLVGLTLSLYYHLLNGIRHLAWDSGWGFGLGQVRLTGWLVVIGAVLLTVASWVAAFSGRGS